MTDRHLPQEPSIGDMFGEYGKRLDRELLDLYAQHRQETINELYGRYHQFQNP